MCTAVGQERKKNDMPVPAHSRIAIMSVANSAVSCIRS